MSSPNRICRRISSRNMSRTYLVASMPGTFELGSIFSLPRFFILGYQDFIKRMGCQLSKSLRFSKRRNGTLKKPLCQYPPEFPSEPAATFGQSESTPEAVARDLLQSRNATTDIKTPEPEISCNTTDSGDAPLESRDDSVSTPGKKTSLLIFDEEVIEALADADRDEALRTEREFEAIVVMTE
jgi:hypothetical protein